MHLHRILTAVVLVTAMPAVAQDAGSILTGEAAYGDWRDDAPGVRRLIRPQDLPAPGATRSVGNSSSVVGRPGNTLPDVPAGFDVDLFFSDLAGPRTIRVAPNGDVFVVESSGGQIRALRAEDGASAPSQSAVFADGLRRPYGMAFYPPGPEPKYIYVAETNRVVRFPYGSGSLEAAGPAETVVASLPSGGHWTRDLEFSQDGKRMFVAIGSDSNDASGIGRLSPTQISEQQSRFGFGAAWGNETNRAVVLVFDPEGENGKTFATGIRNCSGIAIEPKTGDLWCANNERDGLGDNLPPDYASRIVESAFYGWPWYYIGDNEDPRHAGERPDLAGKVADPDVLIQPHSAPLGLAFYSGDAFPESYRGDGFMALHGSWNRAGLTGYKVVRIIMEDGEPTGAYEDFMTGFVLDAESVWGRPTGIGVTKDGALLVSEDGNGTLWRVAPQ